MSSEPTVASPQAQTPAKKIILSYSNNFTPNINNVTSLRNARRNVMAHTRNSSSPASYFNSNPATSHRRVYSAKSLLRESSGSYKSLKSKESNNDDNTSNLETQPLTNSDCIVIEDSDSTPETASNNSDPLQEQPVLQRNGSTNKRTSRSSIRSVHSLSHIHEKRLSRTIQHISSFLQIIANITPTISLPITVEKTYTVERLARQIEAEYAFKFGGIEQVGLYEPLEVGLLYDVSMVALRFRDLVGDVLEHGDVVNVLNIYEDYNIPQDQFGTIDDIEKESTPIKTEVKRYSMPIIIPSTSASDDTKISSHSNSPTTSTSSLSPISHIRRASQDSELNFQTVLSNSLALDYFQKFAIKEYSVENILFWLDVQLFAAGNSCEIEDNYFEEQRSAVIHARYIYLTYINSNAPLQVNISDEIRRDITWPIKDDDIVERNVFEEAQDAVYQLLKGYDFIGFEDSPEWQECIRRKQLDPHEYESREMIEPLENYFHPNMSLMLATTTALDPSIEQSPVSYNYKEQTLHSILSQYFPETLLLDNEGKRKEQGTVNNSETQILNGYFNSENRLTNAQRIRRIKKEKKLQWVFGEKVNGMEDQIIIVPDETLYGDGRIDYDDDTKSITSTISENRKIARDVWNKKKKVEKLESIFGRGLKDSQLYSQNILSEKKYSLTGLPNGPSSPISPNSPSTQNFLSENCDIPHLQTMNELSAKDRRILWKKSKKLQIMFGEALDEDMVRQTLLPGIQSVPPNKEKFSSDDKSTVNDYSDRDSKDFGSDTKKQNRRSSDPTLILSTSNSIPSIVTPPASPPVLLDEKSNNNINTSYKHAIGGVSSINLEAIPLIIVNKDTKEYRRKKLQKLYQFLGEKVPISAVLGEHDYDLNSTSLTPPQSTSLLSPTSQSNSKNKKRRPNSLSFSKKISQENISDVSNTLDQNDTPVTKYSAADRKRHIQRAVKLQKMFGETPPQNLILSPSKFTSDSSSCYSANSSIDLHRRSIMSLEYLMDNDRETMYELIDYMENSDEGENQGDIDDNDQRRKSSPPTPSLSTEFAMPNQHNGPRKQKKLKGIRKLSHFFGATYGQMFPGQVLGELLGDLEREIREEVKQNDELDKAVVAGLMDQLEELRAKTSELGPDSGDEGGTTEGSAITDDESSLKGYRKALEKTHKNKII